MTSPPTLDEIHVLLLGRDNASLAPFRTLVESKQNTHVSIASDLEAGLLSIAQSIPRLIISAWQIENRTALDLLHVMKTQQEWERIPVIIFGEGIPHAMIQRARVEGAIDVFNEPINRRAMQQQVDEILENARQELSGPKVEKAVEVRHKLMEVETIAPLPALVKEILSVHEDPEASAKAMAGVIRKDQSLTSRVLRIVNSAYYGFHRKIGNIKDAVVLLGFEEIKNIALAACLMESFPISSVGSFQPKDFWLHAIATAYISSKISERYTSLKPEDAFVMGLLHDIGKAIMFQHFPETYTTVLSTAAEREQPLHLVERELMEIDHAEVGGIVAESWDLPKTLSRAIRFHHRPNDTEEGIEPFVVNISNFYAHKYKVGASGTPTYQQPSHFALPAVGYEGDFDALWGELEINLDGMKAMLPFLG